MPGQLPIDSYFRRVPKRKMTKPVQAKEEQPKKQKVHSLPSPPLTNPSRQRTLSPIPSSSKQTEMHFHTPSKSYFKISRVPTHRDFIDDDDEVIPSSQTQLLLLSPTSPHIIPSSQTQLLSPVRPLKFSSPHRPLPHPLQTDDDEIVPTSQSQERELQVHDIEPRNTVQFLPEDDVAENIFNDDASKPFGAPLLADSETEPESDDERAAPPPLSSSATPATTRVRKWYTEGSSQPSSVRSTPRRPRPLGKSCSLNDGDGESIPDFIKEMNIIFQGSGSYPDDFPMSLRDI